jgi:hypothetical protein
MHSETTAKASLGIVVKQLEAGLGQHAVAAQCAADLSHRSRGERRNRGQPAVGYCRAVHGARQRPA